MNSVNKSGDSSELESLFDSIAASASIKPAVVAPAQPVAKAAPIMQQIRESQSTTDDSPDLQSLFDSIVAEKTQSSPEASSDSVGEWPVQKKVFTQVGQMTRQLHDTLGTLRFDKLFEKAAAALPDAKDRLNYIADLTEKAAFRVLNATDAANPLQDQLEEEANALGKKWDAVYANQLSTEEFKALAAETRTFLTSTVSKKTTETRSQLLEIMMAQDFQDLTGQVIKKIISLSQDLESQLMGVLIDTMPGDMRTDTVESLLNGPVINADGRTDVVASQQQVDDLLGSLGF